jgi:YHS domain-containing protein
MTKEEIKAFTRRVMGPPKRVLEGQEKEHMLTIFRLIDPVESTNNQSSFTEEYHYAGKTYYVHYFGSEVEIEEVLQE